MKLRKLKEVIDKCVENAGDYDPEVEIWVGDHKAYKVARIGQFGIIPDVTISVGEKIFDDTKTA
jgi:hypothetical protein